MLVGDSGRKLIYLPCSSLTDFELDGPSWLLISSLCVNNTDNLSWRWVGYAFLYLNARQPTLYMAVQMSGPINIGSG